MVETVQNLLHTTAIVNPLQKIQISERAFLPTATVVAVTKNADPALLSQIWLMNNGIVAEADFLPEALFSRGTVVVPTRRFLLNATRKRIQLQLADFQDEQAAQESISLMGKIVRLLPGLELAALGLNFTALLFPPDGAEFTEWNRKFAVPSLKELPGIMDASPLFGTYVSFKVPPFRLTIELKPSKVKNISPKLPDLPIHSGQDMMTAIFNYHRELPSNTALEAINESLEQWKAVFHRTKDIISFFSTIC